MSKSGGVRYSQWNEVQDGFQGILAKLKAILNFILYRYRELASS
jgi:hypothetical protein